MPHSMPRVPPPYSLEQRVGQRRYASRSLLKVKIPAVALTLITPSPWATYTAQREPSLQGASGTLSMAAEGRVGSQEMCEVPLWLGPARRHPGQVLPCHILVCSLGRRRVPPLGAWRRGGIGRPRGTCPAPPCSTTPTGTFAAGGASPSRASRTISTNSPSERGVEAKEDGRGGGWRGAETGEDDRGGD
jgi:hypothetical protein